MHDEQFNRGLEMLAQLDGKNAPGLITQYGHVAPDAVHLAIAFGLGEVIGREVLPLPERQLIWTVATATLGNSDTIVAHQFRAALNVGVTPEQLVETLIQLSLYVGFPCALNAFHVLRTAFSEAGINFTPEPALLDGDRYLRGLTALTHIHGEVGDQVISSLANVAPDFARFIIEFAYGDIYARPAADLRFREIITLAACVSLGNASPEVTIHGRAFLRMGGTVAELREILVQLIPTVGFPTVLRGIDALRELLPEQTPK